MVFAINTTTAHMGSWAEFQLLAPSLGMRPGQDPNGFHSAVAKRLHSRSKFMRYRVSLQPRECSYTLLGNHSSAYLVAAENYHNLHHG